MNDYSNLRLRDMIYALKEQFGVLEDPVTRIPDKPPAPISLNWAANKGVLGSALNEIIRKQIKDKQDREAYQLQRSTLRGGKRSHTKRKKRSKTRKSR
jgi:hypothetical protein